MSMDNYIKQSLKFKNILNKIKINDIEVLVEEIDFHNFNIGVIGNNIKENKDLVDILNDKINIEEIKDLNSMKYDAVIQIIDAVQPVSKGDVTLYKSLCKNCNNIFFMIKRIDLVDEEDRDELLQYIEKKLYKIAEKNYIYIFNDNFINKLMSNFQTIEQLKENSICYKLKVLIDKSIKYLNDAVYKGEHWNEYKNKKILKIEREIEVFNYFGQGLALFLNELNEESKSNEKEVPSTFSINFINGINYLTEKYLQQKVNNADFKICDKKQFIEFVEEERLKINSEISKNINTRRGQIEDLILKNSSDVNIIVLKEGIREINEIKGKL